MRKAPKMSDTEKILELVVLERNRQREQWIDERDDWNTILGWVRLLRKLAKEAEWDTLGPTSYEKLRIRFVKIAAIAVAAAESMDRRIL